MNKQNQKKIFVKSYGCQMNVYDTERIKNLFEPKGYQKTEKIENADIIVLNTCHIREKAAEKVYSDIGRIEKKLLIKITKKILNWLLQGASHKLRVKRLRREHQ